MGKVENFSSPIRSDIDFMWFITNLYLEQGRIEYKTEIENIIKLTRDLLLERVQPKDIDPEIFSIVTALKASNNDEYFKRIEGDNIEKSMIESVRSILSTLRHAQSFR